MSVLRNRTLHGLGGFVLMGSWAGFANRDHPMPSPAIAGLVQGVMTALITAVLKHMIEALFDRAVGWWRIVLPGLAAFAVSVSALSLAHALAGTPALLATIAVPVSVSTVYALSYAYLLSRHV